MRPSSFDRARRLIHEIAGISLNDRKGALVVNRLTRRLEATGHETFESYLDFVEPENSPERVHFANALTTNVTSFFRESHHFPILVEHLEAQAPHASPAIWSAACSTGEEPYSIAMSLIEAEGTVPDAVRIIASDVDTRALEVAALGVYPLAKAQVLGEERLRRFFLKGEGARGGMVKVRPEVRAMVEFRRINLCAERWSLGGTFAAIFCRNAMIYFAKPTQLEILRRFAPLLAGGGLLFAGHSENFHYVASDFLRPRGKTVYAVLE
jgi:chemotaxis protein methyltransferase CheR